MSNTSTAKPHAFFFNPPLESNWWGHIFSEVYKDRIFEPFVRGPKKGVCVEIGANVGIVSYYLAQHFDKVYSLEPSLEHFQMLTKMVEWNGLTDIVDPINKAVYMKSGQYPLFHNRNRTMYSLHGAVDDKTSNPELVMATTLTDLFKDKGIEHVDFMKLDVEGSEHEILGSESFKEVADKIEVILVEYHKWSGRHINQLNESLKNNGFEVIQMPSSAEIIVGQRKK